MLPKFMNKYIRIGERKGRGKEKKKKQRYNDW